MIMNKKKQQVEEMHGHCKNKIKKYAWLHHSFQRVKA